MFNATNGTYKATSIQLQKDKISILLADNNLKKYMKKLNLELLFGSKEFYVNSR